MNETEYQEKRAENENFLSFFMRINLVQNLSSPILQLISHADGNGYVSNILTIQEHGTVQLGSLHSRDTVNGTGMNRMSTNVNSTSVTAAHPNILLYRDSFNPISWVGIGVDAYKQLVNRVGTTSSDCVYTFLTKGDPSVDKSFGFAVQDSGGKYFRIRPYGHFRFAVHCLGMDVFDFNANAYQQIKASSFSVQSSLRYKENIEDITNEEAIKILQIRTVKFDYKNKEQGTNCFGVIAEQAIEIIPYAVSLDYETKEPDSVDYSKFVPHLIKMVQIQQKEINELKNEVGELRREKESSRLRLENLESQMEKVLTTLAINWYKPSKKL